MNNIFSFSRLSESKKKKIARRDLQKLQNDIIKKSVSDKFRVVQLKSCPKFLPFFLWKFFISKIIKFEINE